MPRPIMKAIHTYPTRVEAELDRLTLEAAEIPAVVIGVGTGMEGGIEGVRLLVPEELVDRALELLGRR
jgi:Putative prokaryotic signal transducing protein